MSVLGLYRRLPAGFRYLLPIFVVVLTVQFSLQAVGFGDWVKRTPAASVIFRIFGVLLFGGLGLFTLWGRRHDPEMRSGGYLFVSIALLCMAAIHAAFLFGGESVFSKFLAE